MRLVISGQTPAQKNSKKMSYVSGKAVLYTDKKVKDWQKAAHAELLGYGVKINGKVEVSYVFYMKDLIRRDLDNMIASVNDVIVKAGIIEDDNWQILTIGGASGELDRENPRAEIWIDEEQTNKTVVKNEERVDKK